MAKLKTLLLLLFLPFISYSQCDVFIEQGSVNVIDNGSGIKFEFDITNNSGADWYGDVLKLNWTLNSSAPIWEIDYTTNTNSPPIADGETRTITTPWFDFPTLPFWFPDDPNASQPWEESMEWAYYGLSFPFEGAWSPMNLRLGSCGLADGAWIYDDNGDLYYGPFDSDCPDVNNDAFCDCDVDFIGFDPITYDASISIISHWNCGQPLNGNSPSAEMDHINMLQLAIHVPGWDYNWGCMDATFHEGWTWDNPISFNEYYAGDTINYNLFSDETTYDDCFQEILESDTLTSCLEIVLWQINYSNTAVIGEIDGGWAVTCGTCSNQTAAYPDISIGLNSLNVCDAPPPLYPGCTDPEAENYNPEADFDDGTCIDPPIYGCTDPIACNYTCWNPPAEVDDGSCVYCDTPNGEELCDDCQGEGYFAWYSNIFNCNDITSPDAGVNISTINTLCIDGQPSNSINIFVTNPDTGNYNATDTLFTYCIQVPELGLDTCLNGYTSIVNFIEPGGGQLIWSNFYVPNSITEFTVSVYNVGDELEENSYNNSITYQNIIQDPDVCNTIELTYLDITPIFGCDTTEGGYYIPEITYENTGNITITEFCASYNIYSSLYDEEICWEGILEPGEIVYLQFPPSYNDGIGAAYIQVNNINGLGGGWTEVVSNINYASTADDLCVYGCMDETANNFNPNAQVNDYSCEYDIIELTYVNAECYVDCDLSGPFYYVNTTWTNTGNIEITNFCAEWDVTGGQGDDVECFNGNLIPGDTTDLLFGPYTSEQGLLAWAYLQVLNGVTLDPPIENYETLYCWGSAEASCIYGCIDATANNYDPTADLDDGSCTYDILGCTDSEANNYNPDANIDDGSCTYDVLGCTDPNALNYNSLANVDDGSCEYDVPGCTDPAATNYNPLATVDDGSCEYIIYLGGCTDPEAANYNPMATYDDGSCYYLPEPCDGSYYAPNTFTPNNDGINDGWTVIVADPDCWKEWYIAIYNRWGSLIWESTTVGEIWPASVFDGNHYVADGVYLYLVRGEGWNPEHTFKTTGHITIFR